MDKHILILTLSFPPSVGGIASLVSGLTKHLPAHRVSVATFPAEGWKTYDSRQPFPICRPRLPSFWEKMRLRFTLLTPWVLWSITRCRPQFILCGELHMSILLPAWFAKHLTGASFGVFIHGRDVIDALERGSIYSRIVAFFLHDAQFVIPNSHFTLDNAVKLGVNQSKLHMIFPSVDADELVPQRSPDEIKALHGVQGKRVILHVGNLVHNKGVDKVLQAMPQVLSSFPDAHLLIIGEGPYKENLKRLVNDLGLDAAVTFVGYVPYVADYFATCEFFVMVSRETRETKNVEGFGIVYLEAGLFGKPVIGGRSGGVPDAVLDRKTGVLVDPLNVNEIAETIKLFLRDPSFAHCLGEAGRCRVLQQFTTSAVARQVLTLIDAEG